MNYTTQLALAIKIASILHDKQFDLNGKPYILHPLRVMFKMEYMNDMIAAVLHDVIEYCSEDLVLLYSHDVSGEGTGIAINTLKHIGFEEDEVHTIDMLSKNRAFGYDDYIQRVKSDPSAIKVKIADLEDNMDMRRLPGDDIRNWNRLKRYHKLWQELKALQEK